MASDVEIANRALTKVGDQRITSFLDNSAAARAINSMYSIVRDAEIRGHVWSFSLKRASLAAEVSTPEWGFDYQYQLPSDFLRLANIRDAWVASALNDYKSIEDLPFSIEGQKILTDLPAPLLIRYQYRVTDPAQFDACFVESLACRLAVELCEPLTQSSTKRQQAQDEYKESIKVALMANAIERPPVPMPDDSWIIGRL